MSSDLYENYKKLTNDEIREYFKKANTVEEKDFWSTLLQLRAKEMKITQMYDNSKN